MKSFLCKLFFKQYISIERTLTMVFYLAGFLGAGFGIANQIVSFTTGLLIG